MAFLSLLFSPEQPPDHDRQRAPGRAADRGHGAHSERHQLRGEPLSRDLLELALDLVGDGSKGDKLTDGIANKLISNKPLGDYELHLMVDVFLLHARLVCASTL
ncbi:hypothetical protein [uncultured Castellaniella sp.]|uniref:hypothetical protein n=1 Tax=uncultured Castellaniella sp. TaxID=647907 RepID=UPI002639711D|nr:hypothetical protein [uncultured Castellaniella sp.]